MGDPMRQMFFPVLASALALTYGAPEPLRSEEKLRLWGLSSVVDAVGFSNDGKLAVTGGSVITIWNVHTGKWQFRLTAPPGAWGISGGGVLLLPDNERVLAAGRDKYIRIWVMDTDIPETEIALDVPKDDGARAVALSPDGSTLAVGTMTNVIHLIDMKTQKVTDVLNVHKQGKGYKHSLAFSPDGKRLASAGGGANETIILDMAEKKVLHRLSGGPAWEVMPYVAWSRDGKMLATASQFDVTFWDAATGESLSQLERIPGFPRPGPITGLAFSPRDDVLAVTRDDSIQFWRTDTKEFIAGEQHKGVSCLAFSKDGKLLITGSGSRFEMNAKIWEVPSR
jgi:WD40 repeat protein